METTVINLQRSTGCIFKLKMEILCWGLNYQSDPQVFGTIGKVFSRPFQWSLNFFSSLEKLGATIIRRAAINGDITVFYLVIYNWSDIQALFSELAYGNCISHLSKGQYAQSGIKNSEKLHFLPWNTPLISKMG